MDITDYYKQTQENDYIKQNNRVVILISVLSLPNVCFFKSNGLFYVSLATTRKLSPCVPS